MDHDFRLLRRDGGAVWVNLRAEILSTRQGATVFRGVFLDIDRLRAGGAGPAGGPFPAGDGSAGCGDAAGPDAGRSLPAAPPT